MADYHSGDHGVLTHPKDPHLARQNPADYIGSLGHAMSGALAQADATPGFSRDRVIGIGVDTTGSTPLPIDAKARPLAIDSAMGKPPRRAGVVVERPHRRRGSRRRSPRWRAEHAPQYLEPIGGTYSSEWWWSKIWKCLKVAPEVFEAAHSWVELADFVPAVLAGVDDPQGIVRCVCAAGHKAMFSDAWGGLPSKEFLARLDPQLAELRDRLVRHARLPPGTPAGHLSAEWANVLGLREGIAIAMGGFDAHYGAVGSGIEVGTLVKIIGTSTCDCAIAAGQHRQHPRHLRHRQRIDHAWLFRHRGGAVGRRRPPEVVGRGRLRRRRPESADAIHARHERLSREGGGARNPASRACSALDWNNGNRTILVDPKLTGLIIGQTLHTTRAEIYRALIEATAFGARADHRPDARVTACRSIAWCVAAALPRRTTSSCRSTRTCSASRCSIAGSPQAPALGAAISAAVTAGAAAGGYDAWADAQDADDLAEETSASSQTPTAHGIYDELYAIYRRLHDSFGNVSGAADLGAVMKQLLAIRATVVA